MADDEWVKIIHPETGGIAEVTCGSLFQHYAAGWRPLAEDDIPPPGQQAGEPEPLTEAEVAAALNQPSVSEE